MIKSRIVGKQRDDQPIYALTIPAQFSLFFEETYFYVTKSGNSLIFTSGTHNTISNEEIKKYKFEDVII